MNLLLLKDTELSDHTAVLSGRRHQHIRNVLKLGSGDQIKTGLINGRIGQAEILSITELKTKICLRETATEPPCPISCKVVLAMPRPKMMRRVIQNLVAMGVKDIHLIHSWRVEKSFWQTPWLLPDSLEEQCLLGLEQAVDTIMPGISLHKRFKPFVEDCLPDILADSNALVAHPRAEQACPVQLTEASTLIIGPEGGFTEYEIDMLEKAGAKAVSIGPRILRVETAIPALLSRLYPG